MEIVDRLKKFMETQRIASSQFADSCKIPRPTVSQILNGRNKKISDELIGKIHTAYPKLSILWLMFGEGSMMEDGNIEISEPQIQSELQFPDEQTFEHEIHTDNRIEFEPVKKNQPENSRVVFTDSVAAQNGQNRANQAGETQKQNGEAPKQNNVTGVNVQLTNEKKIRNIIVMFEDNSALTFVPASL